MMCHHVSTDDATFGLLLTVRMYEPDVRAAEPLQRSSFEGACGDAFHPEHWAYFWTHYSRVDMISSGTSYIIILYYLWEMCRVRQPHGMMDCVVWHAVWQVQYDIHFCDWPLTSFFASLECWRTWNLSWHSVMVLVCWEKWRASFQTEQQPSLMCRARLGNLATNLRFQRRSPGLWWGNLACPGLTHEFQLT